jgi:hypothetical protein
LHARRASLIIDSILQKLGRQLSLGDPSIMSNLDLSAEELDFLSKHQMLYTIPDENGYSTG